MKDALQHHFSKNGRKNQLSQIMLPELIAEARANGFGAVEPGDDDESEILACRYLRQAGVLTRKGFRVKTKTWSELIKRMAAHNKEWHAWLYALCVLVHSQGHFKTVWDMPVFGCELPASLVQTLPGDHIAGQHDKAGAAGQKLRSLRARCRNACVDAALCQGERGARQRAFVIVEITRPFADMFSQGNGRLVGRREGAHALRGVCCIRASVRRPPRPGCFAEPGIARRVHFFR